MVVEEVPLIPGYGTHIAYVYVGTPPQRVSVILDTGSHFTAFPCKGCKACGDHTDSYWDFDLSSTATLTKCPDCHGNFNCGANQRCVFSQSYSEGSSWSAFQVIDKLYTGLTTLQDTPPDDAALSIDFMFGCINSQTGLFNTQLADGIMGMSVSEFTLVWQLHQKGLLAQEKFSLCFDYGGGVMVLGGVEPLLRTAPMQYTPNLHDEGWFTVDLQDILIGGESINVDPAQYNRGKGVIVDSGTTDTYLPSACADGFRAQWQALTGMAYDNKPMKLSKAQFAALPTFTFVFAGGVRVDVKPEAYMDVAADHDGAGYTPRMYLDERDGAVLGANFMRDHDVVFDHANKRVGFAPANCDWSALQAAKTAAADAAAAAAAAAATAQPEPEPPAPSERPPPATMDTEPPSDPAPAETASPTKLPAGAQGVPATPAATQEPQATEAAATAEPQKGGADAASTEEPAAGGGEGGGATGTPEPTVEVTPEAIPEAQETPAPGLCETEADALVKVTAWADGY
ncbi:aspartic peptidase domain-containing protein [Tribonema minus]|uniref:Aspartic peptidase domain-containing protein n=1 Tax=Tribonema minus TaxID=303371 RepID=A0A835ZHP7_9STRA|nr:aspartic peptidase domain-containing protein [Tribonema minus]